MMKPGIGTYDRFKQMFDRFSKEAGKEQYLIPYFIAAHPGTTEYDMMNLAIWLKKNGFRADQVQTFYPSPMATATTMYHTGKNPLAKVARYTENVDIVKGERRRQSKSVASVCGGGLAISEGVGAVHVYVAAYALRRVCIGQG